MSNAMKYRRERMEVKISGEVDLVVLVEDDGIGIPLEDQEIIFKRFVRLNDEKRPYVPGLGLGLTGVKTLVEAMGGEITLESQEGVGNTIYGPNSTYPIFNFVATKGREQGGIDSEWEEDFSGR